MALSASRNVDFYVDQQLRTFRVKGSTTVYKGAWVGITSAGFARGLVAGDAFAGLAYEEKANAGSDGAKTVRVYTQGDFEASVSNAAQTDVGRPVFASADDTLTFVGAGNSYVGVVQDFVSSGVVIVRIDPLRKLIKVLTHAVENVGAGVDIAARAIHSFREAGWVIAAYVLNQASAAAGVDASNSITVTIASAAGQVVQEVFDASPAFPSANARASLGAVTNPFCPAGDVLTAAVLQGTTANAGPFLILVDYV